MMTIMKLIFALFVLTIMSVDALQEQHVDANEIKTGGESESRLARPQWLVNLRNKYGYYVYTLADCIGRDLDADCAQSMISCAASPSWADCISGALCGGWPAFNRCKASLG